MRDRIEADREGTRSRNGSGAGSNGGSRGGHSARGGRLSGGQAVQAAREHLESLTGQPCESVSALLRTREGWAITLEVVELERVPRSTDILASYRVDVDNEGELMGYERVHRYYRNQAGGD